MLFIMQSLHQKDNVKFRYKKGFTSQLVFFFPETKGVGTHGKSGETTQVGNELSHEQKGRPKKWERAV